MTQRLLALALATAGFAPAAAVAAEPPTLIPRKVLFGNPVQAAAQVSPDGRYLTYLAPDSKDVLQVFVRPLAGGEAKQVTQDPKRGIRIYAWTYHPDTLLYLQDKDGDENFHVFAANVATASVRELTPFPGVRAQGIMTDRDVPGELLVG